MDEAVFKAWKAQDDTKAVFKYFEAVRKETMDIWASGGFTAESAEGTMQLNSEAIGMVKVLNDIHNLEAEDVSS